MPQTSSLNRRETLGLLAGTVAGAAARLAAAASDTGPSRTGLGLVIYTQGIRRRMLKARDPSHDLFQPAAFLERCRELGAGGVQLPLGNLEAEAAEALRQQANEHGLFIEGIVAPPFEDDRLPQFRTEIETASRAGARVVRTVIIPGRRYERFKSRDEFDRFAERGRRALERARPIVEQYDVRLAVENHKDQRFDERLALLQGIDSPFVGACVDTGNSFALLEDPMNVVESLAPFAFSVHLKDQAVQECEDGFLFADVALGQGFLDLERMVAILRRAQPDVRFSLETITRDPLRVPCLAPDYWATFADVPGSDLARTLRTVRQHAAKQLPHITSLSLEDQAAAEEATVVQSLDYARDVLGI